MERIYATYWLETWDDPTVAAEVIAGEQSSGTFVKLAMETPELKERAGARIERLEVLDSSNTPSLPTPVVSKKYTRAMLEISWPLDNLGPCLPTLMATIAGNLYELRCVTGLRLLDLQLPMEFANVYPGPAFGIEGTRRLSGVNTGPLIGTIIKPSVGLSVSETAEQVQLLVDGGIDFIKDDELQADGPACPFEERVGAVMRVINKVADRTGKKPMVAFNLTGDLDLMRRRHDLVLAEGGTCVMACLNSVGIVGMHELRKHSQLPIHAHRAGWGYLNRSPELGFDYKPWQKIWRLLGADHLHVNGLSNKFSESDESVMAAAQSVLAPVIASAPMTAVPVFSSGQTGLQAHATFEGLGSADLIHTVGGGIFGHPGGVSSGVQALRDSWSAAMSGVSLEQASQASPSLAQALTFWK
jgi:ribulose-bisphosphate carboxylase large chain